MVEFSIDDCETAIPLVIKEILTEEEKREGLEAEIYEFLINISRHAQKRMSDDRDIEELEILNLLNSFGTGLLNIKNGENFALVDSISKLVVFCDMVISKNGYFINVITAIKKDHVFIKTGTTRIDL